MMLLAMLLVGMAQIPTPAHSAVQEGSPLQPGARAPLFTLRDQYDREFDLAGNRGTTLVLLIGRHEVREELKRWAREITKRYPQGVECIFIISFPDVPFFLKGWIKGKFKSGKDGRDDAPDGVLIDWGEEVFRLYDSVEQSANVILIDDKGLIRGMARGSASLENKERIFGAIDDSICPLRGVEAP